MINTKIRLIIFFAAKDGAAVYIQQKTTGVDCDSDHELLIAKFSLELNEVRKTTGHSVMTQIKSFMVIQPK